MASFVRGDRQHRQFKSHDGALRPVRPTTRPNHPRLHLTGHPRRQVLSLQPTTHHTHTMSILSSIGQGMLLLSLLVVACTRLRRRRRRPASRRRIPLDRLPDSQSLSGVPLRILLSDRSGPGPLLRDMLLVRPDPGERPRPHRDIHPPTPGQGFAPVAPSAALLSTAHYR